MSEEQKKAIKKIILFLKNSIAFREQEHYSELGRYNRSFFSVITKTTYLEMTKKRLKSYYRGDLAYRGCRIEQLSHLYRTYRTRDPHVQGVRDRLITDNDSAGVSIMRFIDTMTTYELLDHGI